MADLEQCKTSRNAQSPLQRRLSTRRGTSNNKSKPAATYYISKQFPRQHCRQQTAGSFSHAFPVLDVIDKRSWKKQVTIDSSPRTLDNVSDNRITHVELPDRERTIRRCQALYLRNCAPLCTKLEPKICERNATGEATTCAVLMIVEKRCPVEAVAFLAPTQSFSSTAERRFLILATTRASTGTPLEHGCAPHSFGSPEHGCASPSFGSPSTGAQAPGPVLGAMGAHSA